MGETNVISQGIPKSRMLANGSIFTENQITDVLALIRQFPYPQLMTQPTRTVSLATVPTFITDILYIKGFAQVSWNHG